MMLVLTHPNRYEEEIKRSRFIAQALSTQSVEDTTRIIREVSDSEATHNCWAYRIGSLYRFSDDGEPGGTAGRPILAAIDGQRIDRVVVVVTRFFGGTKLGAGGLVRAYGGVVAECLRRASTIPLRPMVDLEVHVPFEAIGELYALLEREGVSRQSEDFQADGVVVSVRLPADARQEFETHLRDSTRGRGRVR